MDCASPRTNILGDHLPQGKEFSDSGQLEGSIVEGEYFQSHSNAPLYRNIAVFIIFWRDAIIFVFVDSTFGLFERKKVEGLNYKK